MLLVLVCCQCFSNGEGGTRQWTSSHVRTMNQGSLGVGDLRKSSARLASSIAWVQGFSCTTRAKVGSIEFFPNVRVRWRIYGDNLYLADKND